MPFRLCDNHLKASLSSPLEGRNQSLNPLQGLDALCRAESRETNLNNLIVFLLPSPIALERTLSVGLNARLDPRVENGTRDVSQYFGAISK